MVLLWRNHHHQHRADIEEIHQYRPFSRNWLRPDISFDANSCGGSERYRQTCASPPDHLPVVLTVPIPEQGSAVTVSPMFAAATTKSTC